MSRRIQEDHKEFRDVVRGKVDDQIQKFIKNGKLVGWRPKGGKFVINVPQIDLPTLRFGRDKGGWGRGEGDEGDIVGQDPQKGKDQGKAGNTPGNTVPVGVDLEEIMKFLQDELELPNMEPKDSTEVFNEKTVYTGLRKTGPESLRHNRKTMRQAMLRMIQTGEYDPRDPIIIPIQDDKRYRSWNIKQIPQSNAVIFFARDWSGSMNNEKCDIVVNTAWWIDQWIRQFYERTETIYIGHDTEAHEVDQDKFYEMRYGGGTYISSAFDLINEKIEFTFPTNQWNIYIFYFSDGENWTEDNEKCAEIIKNLQVKANLIGVGQILHHGWGGQNSFLQTVAGIEGLNLDVVRMFDYQQVDPAKGIGTDQEFQMIKHFLSKEGMAKAAAQA